jgi:hypothetical protein
MNDLDFIEGITGDNDADDALRKRIAAQKESKKLFDEMPEKQQNLINSLIAMRDHYEMSDRERFRRSEEIRRKNRVRRFEEIRRKNAEPIVKSFVFPDKDLPWPKRVVPPPPVPLTAMYRIRNSQVVRNIIKEVAAKLKKVAAKLEKVDESKEEKQQREALSRQIDVFLRNRAERGKLQGLANRWSLPEGMSREEAMRTITAAQTGDKK